jgi:hypothetical protein
LAQTKQRLKDTRLPSVIRPDEDSNRCGLNQSVFVQFEVLEADAFQHGLIIAQISLPFGLPQRMKMIPLLG